MYDVFKRICDAEYPHTHTYMHVLRPHFHITVIQTHSIDSVCIGQSVVWFIYLFSLRNRWSLRLFHSVYVRLAQRLMC